MLGLHADVADSNRGACPDQRAKARPVVGVSKQSEFVVRICSAQSGELLNPFIVVD